MSDKSKLRLAAVLGGLLGVVLGAAIGGFLGLTIYLVTRAGAAGTRFEGGAQVLVGLALGAGLGAAAGAWGSMKAARRHRRR